ncbi:MAG: phosphatase [Lachnospiraceae bacterium]
MDDIMDLHTHTIASGHAYNTLYEMVHTASRKGLHLLGVTEHAPLMPGSCHPFYFLNLGVVPREIDGVKLVLGCELDIIDYQGTIDLDTHYLKKLDYAVASIHDPCYKCGSVTQNTEAYLGAMKNPAVQIIGHPDDGRFPVDYDTIAAAASEHGVLLEVNSSSLHPRSHRQNAYNNYLTMLERCRHYQTSVILDSDAHCEVDVGNHSRAWDLLREIDFPAELVVNSSIARAAAFIPALSQPIYQEGNSHD